MNPLTLMVWSLALGVIGTLGLGRALDLLRRTSRSRLRAVSYHASVFLLVLILSGVLQQANSPAPGRLHVLQVLAGPLCVGFSTFWIHGWLAAAQRDRTMAVLLQAGALVLPLAGVLALLLPHEQQLPAAAAAALLGSGMMSWLTLRAWLMGDRMALLMALGCLLTLPAIAGLYALAMELLSQDAGAQAALALCAASSNAMTGLVLWRRDREVARSRRLGRGANQLDPLTRLPWGPTLVRQLIGSLQRRHRSGRDGALLAVVVYDVQRLLPQVGSAGLQAVWLALVARMQHQLGVVNPVGRYWDHCFVAMVEAIPTPLALRTLGLKLSTSLRRPFEVPGPGGQPLQVQLELGVGVVHLPPGRQWLEIEDLLDEAQQLAGAARSMRSRAAVLDPASGQPVAVEHARLAPRRRLDRLLATSALASLRH